MAYTLFLSKKALLSRRGSSLRGIFLGAALSVMVGGLPPVFLWGQTQPDVLGFDRDLFAYHFDRADREITAEQWLSEARRGISLARSSWERLAAELYGEPGAFEAAERRIEGWSESELETRFTEWLLKRYFGGALGVLNGELTEEIEEANRLYLFHTDGEGRILRDPDTGDPLVIRPGEGDILIDREKWRLRVEDAVSAELGKYKDKLAGFFPELLAYIPPERRAEFEEKLEETALAASSRLRVEFENLAIREERLFVSRRVGDVFSLRRKSEDEAASMISARLIAETEAVCAEGIAALEERIEAAEGGGGDLVLAGTEWLAAYREQFERGLKAWEEAEEGFFIRRMEWEQEAGREYTEGEEAWSAAFARFEQERRNWEIKAKALFDSGEKLFQKASENLERAIAEAKREFEADANLRTAAGADRAQAWVDMYITSGSVVTGAQENIDFWLKQYGIEDAPPLGDEALTEWLEIRQKDGWLEIKKNYEKQRDYIHDKGRLIIYALAVTLAEPESAPSLEEQYLELKARFEEEHALWYEIDRILTEETTAAYRESVVEQLKDRDLYFGTPLEVTDEIRKWSELYNTYMAKAVEARDALVKDFAMIIGTGGLADILAPGAASEDFNLDEYQIELIRAKAVAGYWEKRVSIAEAVLAYAEEISAGRMTDGEGVKAWEAAKQAYDAAVIRYEDEQKRLSAAGVGVAEARESLYDAAEKLRIANDKLEELNRAYAVLMAAYSANRGDFILEELASKYRELLKEQELLNSSGTEGAYVRYLERARELGLALETEGAGELLQRLVTGDQGAEKSLAELRAAVSKISVPGGTGTIPTTVEGFGLDPENTYYTVIKELLSEREAKIAEAGGEAEKISAGERYGKLLISLAKAAKAEAEGLLQTRLQGLNMLLKDSAEEWYFSTLAYEPAQEELAAFQEEGLEQRLIKDAEMSRRRLLRERLELELEGLNYILKGGAASDRIILLSSFCIVDPSQAVEIAERLNYLREIIGRNINGDDETYRDKLEEAAGTDSILRWFLRGGSFFHEEFGAKIAESFLEDYAAAKEGSEGLLTLYQTFGLQTPMGRKEKWERDLKGLEGLFSSYGIEGNGDYLPGVAVMGQAIINRGGIPAENLGLFLARLEEQLEILPEWLGTEFDTWKTSFIEYMAARLVYTQKDPGKSGEALQRQERVLQERLQAVQAIYDVLSEEGPGSIRALSAAWEMGPEGFTLLNRGLLETEVIRRIGAELADLYGAMDIHDEAALNKALGEGALRYYGFAGEAVRQKAAEEALAILRFRDAVNTGANADKLEGSVKRIRLNQLFFGMGIAGAEQNTAAFQIRELAEYFTDPSGEEAPPVALMVSYIGELRDAYGEAGIITERMLGAALALKADSLASFKTILETLGLNTGGEPESFYEQVRAEGFYAPADILKFKNPAAGEGMLFRLKYLLYSGDWDTYQREFDSYQAYITEAYSGDPGGFAQQQDYLREAGDFAALLDAGRTFSGSAVSGDPVQWALRQQTAGPAAAINLIASLLSAGWDDPFILGLGIEKQKGDKDVFAEILYYELNNYYFKLLETGKGLIYQSALVNEYERISGGISEEEKKGEQHWRQFITEDYLAEYNDGTNEENKKLPAGTTGEPEGDYKTVKGALDQGEGILADAFMSAERNRLLLNDALALYNENEDFAGMEVFRAEVIRYRNNPGLDWDGSSVIDTAYSFYDNYFFEQGEIGKHIANEEYLRREINRLGSGYDIVKIGLTAILAEKEKKTNEILRLQEEYAELAKEYTGSADAFMSAGNYYETLYGEAKEGYEALEDARFHYETQDAIRRWASTAYLDGGGEAQAAAPYTSPYDDMLYSRERWERAKTALAALSGLYDNGETRRPYEDERYEELYKKYEESFGRMILSLKALDSIDGAVKNETQKNDAYYQSYRSSLMVWGRPAEITGAYTSSPDRSEWETLDLIGVKDGGLVFSYDVFFRFNGMTGEQAVELEDYFAENKSLGTETNNASLFEEALRGLSERMAGYAFDSQKYKQWGLARDYLIKLLTLSNPDVEFLQSLYESADALKSGQNLGNMPIHERLFGFKSERLVSDDANSFLNKLSSLQKEAWNGLSQQEKADLEFYTIITLFGGGGNGSSAFSQVSKLEEFRNVWNEADSRYKYLAGKASHWLTGFIFRSDRDMLKATRDHIKPSYDRLNGSVNRGLMGLGNSVKNLNSDYAVYKLSCDYLAMLRGDRKEDEMVVWDDLLSALKAAGDLSEDELANLEAYWIEMNQNTEGAYTNNIEALSRLIQWSKNEKEDIKRDLEQAWVEDEQSRQKEEAEYREAAESYIAGKTSLQALLERAAAAFGRETAAGKNHLENLERVVIKDLSGVMENGSGYRMEYIGLAEEYVSLIQRAYAMRYNGELKAREAEWLLQRRDIQEKYASWRETAALILERGREDWKLSTVKFSEAYNQWVKRYQEEYLRVSDLWSAAYLTGLEDKETWIAQATAAANSASSGAMLALVGADAEMMTRAMDIRIPAGMAETGGIEEAENTLAQLLGSAGIVNLSNAFDAMNGAAGTVAGHLRRGIGGAGVWNAGTIQAAALTFAKETNEILADRETRKIAADIRKITMEAIKGLGESLNEANKGFRESMDDMFIIEGQWKRNGRNYIKDVVVNSTFFSPVVTEQAAIKGYEDYVMEPVVLKTEIKESQIENLDRIAVQALIEDMFKEVSLLGDELFGSNEENSKEGQKERTLTIDEYREKTRYVYQTVTVMAENGDYQEQQIFVPETYKEFVKSEERTLMAGKFGRHIGYQPVIKTGVSADQGKNDIFVDKGTGQLGKLMGDYIYWSIQEGKGVSAMAMAAWDKPLWDSRGSSFSAPSIRSAAEIGFQIIGTAVSIAAGVVLSPVTGGASLIGAIALTTAINTSDDLFFGVLDGVGGYKQWDEVGFEFGKKVVVTAASSAVSAGFSAMGTTAGAGISAVITRTAKAGLQTMAAGTVTSTLNAVTYDRERGFGWSEDIFNQGMRGSAVNTLANMTGTFTGGMLGQMDMFDGNNNALAENIFNRKNMEKLNNLAGGLAGQGVSYAMGEDFTLNLLNASLFTGGNVNAGLLELRFGRDGTGMGLGDGGADISPENIAASMIGLYDALKVGGAKISSLLGKDENLSTLNAVNMLGYTGDALNEAIGQGIWKNRIKAVYGDLGTDEKGNEIMGMYNRENGSEITLAETLLGKGNEKAAKLASVMAHEGLHLTGNRYEYAAHAQGLGTYAGLINQFNMEGDAGFLNMMIDELANPASYGANTGNADYWILRRDGSLVNDNQGYLKDENGFYINRDGTRTTTIIPGQTIGAGGIETGLLNILYGGTSGTAYEIFSDEQVVKAQELLRSSGFIHNGAEAVRDRYWNNGNDNKSISFADIGGVFGNTVAAQVFMNGMDAKSDKVVFGSLIERFIVNKIIPDNMRLRFDQFVYAKSNFYDGVHELFPDTGGLSVSQYFSKNNFYSGDQHRGVDVRGAPGTPIQSGYEGKVVRNYNSQSAGNSVVVEYGFNFEDSFYTTGIQAQFMHLKNPSTLSVNTLVGGQGIVGFMGNTGLVIPEPTTENPDAGTHLHYQLMGNLSGYGAGSEAWTIQENRRERFLAQIGAPEASRYVVNQGTFFLNNYTGMGYNNYFYNPNNFFLGMGL
jgi:murein DD-endopeptidase MepM/ murein hydrolase activator NlpD